ncbi:MAG: hypothetical protein ACYC6N_21040 [Pirellulaceae bacterium]
MKKYLLTLATVILVGGWLLIDESTADTSNTINRNGKVNLDALHEMLTKGLKATREDEKIYIAYVVMWVGEEKLPVSLVYAAFDYARKRRPEYPFPYFHYSLKTLAKRKNIEL